MERLYKKIANTSIMPSHNQQRYNLQKEFAEFESIQEISIEKNVTRKADKIK